MNNIETMKLALEALERIDLWLKARYSGIGLVGVELEAITALRQAIEQAQQAEPDRGVYWKCVRCQYAHIEDECPHCGFNTRAEFKSPPPRQPLTENEIKHLWYEACQTNLELTSQLVVHLARNIEKAHGIKEKNT